MESISTIITCNLDAHLLRTFKCFCFILKNKRKKIICPNVGTNSYRNAIIEYHLIDFKYGSIQNMC